MSGICGWFSASSPACADESVIERMAARLGPHGRGDERISKEITGIGALAGSGLAVSTGRSDGIIVAVQGCPVWASSAPGDWSGEGPFHETCATAYRQLGPELLRHLNGQFALAIIDQPNKRLLLAVDRTGTESLCYARLRDGVSFATTTVAITEHPAVTRTIDLQAIYDYVYFHMVPGPGTVLKDVFRLLPGHYLYVDQHAFRTENYWSPDYRSITYENFATRKDTLRSLLRECVRDAFCDGKAGAFLSGGTDSSTVAGVLTEVLGSGARTYSIGFDAEGYDESEYARTAAKHFGTIHREYYVTPEDVVRAVPLIASSFDSPFGNASAIPAYYCARLAAEDGLDTLLGGDGGDELFGGNARYAKQWMFSLYERIPGALRTSMVEPILGALPARGPISKLRSYVEQSNLGMPERIESYNLLTRLGCDRVFSEDFLAQVQTERPIQLVREIYWNAHADNTLNRMLALDMRLTLADNDLRKVVGACEAAGIKATFPLLDRRLIEFAERLPPDWKVRRTRLRDFFKRALADFLPEQVITKSKHGFGLPFGVWMQTHAGLHQLATESLLQLRDRGIVRADFIDELTGTHLERHAAYYGTMIWILMMLELWMQSSGM